MWRGKFFLTISTKKKKQRQCVHHQIFKGRDRKPIISSRKRRRQYTIPHMAGWIGNVGIVRRPPILAQSSPLRPAPLRIPPIFKTNRPNNRGRTTLTLKSKNWQARVFPGFLELYRVPCGMLFASVFDEQKAPFTAAAGRSSFNGRTKVESRSAQSGAVFETQVAPSSPNQFGEKNLGPGRPQYFCAGARLSPIPHGPRWGKGNANFSKSKEKRCRRRPGGIHRPQPPTKKKKNATLSRPRRELCELVIRSVDGRFGKKKKSPNATAWLIKKRTV